MLQKSFFLFIFSFTSAWGNTAFEKVLQKRCISCHSASYSSGGINLESLDEIKLLVDFVNPRQSFLLMVIEKDFMPLNNPMPEKEKQIIRDWVENFVRDMPGLNE